LLGNQTRTAGFVAIIFGAFHTAVSIPVLQSLGSAVAIGVQHDGWVKFKESLKRRDA
jgi:hypothetical protein